MFQFNSKSERGERVTKLIFPLFHNQKTPAELAPGALILKEDGGAYSREVLNQRGYLFCSNLRIYGILQYLFVKVKVKCLYRAIVLTFCHISARYESTGESK